jgi:hypothetical protein
MEKVPAFCLAISPGISFPDRLIPSYHPDAMFRPLISGIAWCPILLSVSSALKSCLALYLVCLFSQTWLSAFFHVFKTISWAFHTMKAYGLHIKQEITNCTRLYSTIKANYSLHVIYKNSIDFIGQTCSIDVQSSNFRIANLSSQFIV